MAGPRPQPARPRAPQRQDRDWRFPETTSDLAGKADYGMQGLSTHPSFRNAPRASAIGERLGLIGTGLSLAEAQQGYMRDLKRMPADEAFMGNFGAMGVRAAGGTAGAMIGGAGGTAVAGPVGSVAGGIAGGMLGEKAAEPLAKQVLPAYRAGKTHAEKTVEYARALAEHLAQYNTTEYYLRRYRLQP